MDAFSIRYGISSNGEPINNANSNIAKLLDSNVSSLKLPTINLEQGRESRFGNPLGQLAAINQELIRRKQRYTNNDPGVLALVRERNALRSYIEMTAGGSITLPGRESKSKDEAQELILEFQGLKRNAERDISTLNTLESHSQLEQARQTDPGN